MNTQAHLSSFCISNSFASMNSESGYDATDKYERDIFWEYSNDEEASGQIDTGMDS